jgi:hypothetical protein
VKCSSIPLGFTFLFLFLFFIGDVNTLIERICILKNKHNHSSMLVGRLPDLSLSTNDSISCALLLHFLFCRLHNTMGQAPMGGMKPPGGNSKDKDKVLFLSLNSMCSTVL